jgi:parallel beta-helix repeat protein
MSRQTLLRTAGAVFGGLLLMPAPLRAASVCVRAGDPGCLPTIQAAVDQAGAGDVITVSAGVYYENVNVFGDERAGLQIVGETPHTAIIDGSPYADRGAPGGFAALSISAPNVVVRGIAFRNGLIGIITGHIGTVLDNLRFRGTDNPIYVYFASGARITGSDFRDCWGCLIVYGEDARAERNTFQNGFGGIDFDGRYGANRPVITRNRLDGVGGGIRVASVMDPVVRGNVVRQCSGGIFVSGLDPIVERNEVTGGGGLGGHCNELNFEAGPGDDVPARCTRGLVANNTVTDSLSHGLWVTSSAPTLIVRDNILSRGLGFTAYAAADENTSSPVLRIERNRVANAGLYSERLFHLRGCFELQNSAAELVSNTALRCSVNGFYVNGFDSLLASNIASDVAGNGFTVDGYVDPTTGTNHSHGNRLERNTATSNTAQGVAILNGAEITTVTENVATDNRTDFCDEGLYTFASGNTFGTTGPCAIVRPTR